jgi:4'-phosphopantetheinyl transferase
MSTQPDDRDELRDGDVHVWLASLVEDEERTAELHPLLDREEAASASRFAYARLRMHFVQSHAITRRILAGYAGAADPADLVFARGRHGKPRLVAPAAAFDLQFSLSHSGDRCVLAVRRGRSVGIDIEQRREMPGALDIARRNFTAPEIRMLAGLRGSAQREGFFTLWTRKEAVTKAMGASLAANLKRVDVSGCVPLASPNGDPARLRGWIVFDLDLGPDLVAALATAHPVRNLRHFAWNEPWRFPRPRTSATVWAALPEASVGTLQIS